jgi:hypothetical protein
VSAEQPAVLSEEFAEQRVREGGEVADGANAHPFEAEHRGRPATGQPDER